MYEKNRDSRRISGFGIYQCWIVIRHVWSTFERSSTAYSTWASTVSRYKQRPPCDASLNLIYDTNRRRYAEGKLSKTFLTIPIRRPLTISPPNLAKPMSGTELCYRAIFHTDWPEISICPRAKYTFLIGDSPGGYRSMLYIFRKLPSSRRYTTFDT